jgi:hypothetical protein
MSLQNLQRKVNENPNDQAVSPSGAAGGSAAAERHDPDGRGVPRYVPCSEYNVCPDCGGTTSVCRISLETDKAECGNGGRRVAAPKYDPAEAAKNRRAWQQFEAVLMRCLDVRAVLTALGAEFIGGPDGKGWVACRLPDGPLGKVCLRLPWKGRFVGHAGDLRLSFYELLARLLGYRRNWRRGRSWLAERLGVEAPGCGGEPLAPGELLYDLNWDPGAAERWCAAGGGVVDPLRMQEVAAYRCEWPMNAPERARRSVFAVAAYDAGGLFDVGEVGYSITPAEPGTRLQIFQGRGHEPLLKEVSTVTGSAPGLQNKYALERIIDGRSQVVYVVGDIKDLLALHSCVPAGCCHTR